MKRVFLYGLTTACVAAQGVMIDDFETGPFDAVLLNSYVSQSGLPSGNAIGGTRAAHGFNTGGFLRMTCTAGGTGNLVLDTSQSSLSDVFWLGPLANGVPPNGVGTLLPEDFDGISPAIDLTGLNFFKIDYTASSNDYQVNVHVYNSDLTESVSSQFIPVAQGSGQMFISFNVFSGGGVYSQAGGFRLGMEALDDGLLTLHSFEVVAVPEPATFLTVGIGLLAVIMRRRK